MVDMYSYRTSRSSNNNPPSFSSTLLDSIYHSIDQGEAMRKKQTDQQSYGTDASSGGNTRRGVFRSDEEEMANFQRACMIEKWMEKKVGEKVVNVRRKSAGDWEDKKSRKNSSSSSSESSCETFPVHGLKPVRTGGCTERFGKSQSGYEFGRSSDRRVCASDQLERVRDIKCHEQQQKKSSESGFLKTKSRALKIYGDLKKAKQPISPGGKLAAFLNSIFAGAGNVKKPKTGDDSPSVKSTNTSTTTCSSASSFSRSCLSKTPTSRGKSSSGGPKRSVRFSPVSMIIDEDCEKSGHHFNSNSNSNNKNDIDLIKKSNNNNISSSINEELMVHVMEKNRRVEEIARDLLRNYQKKIIQAEDDFDHLKKVAHQVQNQRVLGRDFDEDDEDDDDAASCASSDLFELDNLSAIGMERYTEELPVYETTHLDTNRAIASGLIL